MTTVNILRTTTALLTICLVATVQTAWAETIDLSTVNADFTAKDGDELTGRLGAKVKISRADGAWVTLNNATIDGGSPGGPEDYPWAGLTCLGDATIELVGTSYVRSYHESYSGIYVPENHTLVIQGTGALTAESNDAAGIGASIFTPCGISR